MFFGRRVSHEGDSLCKASIYEKREKPLRVGGQAVIEGVMIRSPKSLAVAVRKSNGEIVLKQEVLTFFSEKTFLFKLPVIRGIITLIAALVLGIRALNFSANEALSDSKEKKDPSPWIMGLTLMVAFCFGLFLFFLIPLFLTRGLRFVIPMISESGLFFNLVDGIIRLMIFLAYIWGISWIPEVRKVFEYHGAEHKSIFAYEEGEGLSIDRAKKFPILHPRCGTSFLVIVLLVSLLFFAMVPHHLSFGYKVASRVVFIPFIAGISYEIIRFSDRKRENRGMQYFIKPGLWLQRLTAREPSEAQIEVALRALQAILEMEGDKKEKA